MRYRLRTLLIVLAVGPPLIAAIWLDVLWDFLFDYAFVVLLAGCYFAWLVLLLPGASSFWRNEH
ncbi:MAG: hypothetical protein L0211_01905 [Planctomycetaceae bacterium]|nr:hypothetical protein [Planctomycetaceae bacterium]